MGGGEVISNSFTFNILKKIKFRKNENFMFTLYSIHLWIGTLRRGILYFTNFNFRNLEILDLDGCRNISDRHFII